MDSNNGHWQEVRGNDAFTLHYYACSECYRPALRDGVGVQVLSALCSLCLSLMGRNAVQGSVELDAQAVPIRGYLRIYHKEAKK